MSNILFKAERVTWEMNGASQAPAYGVETVTCFSRSPKKAFSFSGDCHTKFEGETATPIMSRTRFYRGHILLSETHS